MIQFDALAKKAVTANQKAVRAYADFAFHCLSLTEFRGKFVEETMTPLNEERSKLHVAPYNYEFVQMFCCFQSAFFTFRNCTTHFVV